MPKQEISISELTSIMNDSLKSLSITLTHIMKSLIRIDSELAQIKIKLVMSKIEELHEKL